MCQKTNYHTSNTHIDKCMRPLIKYLQVNLFPLIFKIRACCCGHGKYPITVIVEAVKENKFYELFTRTPIPRKRKFYKKDKDGYYYIPEVI